MIFVVERTETHRKRKTIARATEMRAQAGRALVQAGHKSKQFGVVFSQKKPKL